MKVRRNVVFCFIEGVFILILMTVIDCYSLSAGVAKGIITPDIGKKPVGVFGVQMDRVSKDITARVLVLNDNTKRLVIITYDLNCLDVATPILRSRLEKELSIGPAFFIPIATHNHCAPIQIVPENFEYGRWLAERIYNLILEAIRNEESSVSVRFSHGYLYHLLSVGNAPVDYEIQVLSIWDSVGKPIAILFNHPTHPLQVAGEDNVIHPGHFGFALDFVEEKFPSAVALFGNGCGGNQFTKRFMHAPIDIVKAYGKELADEVIKIVNAGGIVIEGNIDSTFQVISLSLSRPISRENAEKLAVFYPTNIGFVPYPNPHRSSNWIRSLLRHYRENIPFPTKSSDKICTDDGFLVEENPDGREFPCRYEESIVARIGPLIFVALQGEVCAPIGMKIKDAFRYEHPIMVFGYMGEHNLYIPTREIVRLGLYQAKVIQEQYASPVGWAPTVEDEMVSGVRSQIFAILQGR